MDFWYDLRQKTSTTRQRRYSHKLGLHLSGFSWLIIALGILLLVGLWLYTWQQINDDYDRSIAESSRETRNLAIAFEEYVRRIVADADKDLLNLKKAYERVGKSSAAFNTFMDSAANDPSRNLVALYNDQGSVVTSLIQNVTGSNHSDRAYFQVQRDSDSQEMFIGRSFIGGASGQETIPVTRRVNNPDGSFGGVVLIGLKVSTILEFYKKIELGQDQRIALIGTDGFIRVRQVGNNIETGQDIRGSLNWQTIQAGGPQLTYMATNQLDSILRIKSYRAMPDYPLIVSVGKSTQVALADYEKRKQAYIFGALLASLFSLALSGLLVDRCERQLAHHADMENCVSERTDALERANVKLAEQAQILELARDYILMTDLAGKIIYWNRGAEAGYGWKANEAKGQVVHSLLKTQFPVSAEDMMVKLLGEGRWEGELIHTHKEGSQIIVYSYLTLKRDEVGNPMTILEINHDITKQKKMEVDIARLDRLTTVGEMAASIGHEVRNPLTTVRGYLQYYGRKAVFAEYRDQMDQMIAELDRANGIITEFLSLAKNKTMNMKSIHLNQVVQSIVPLLESNALLRGRRIKLELADIPEVIADDKEIRQCILNLVGNGLDASAKGGTVTIATARNENKVVLTVRDKGTGIPPEIKNKLGTPFLTTKENGAGLGLAVCYRIAQRHQAALEVETGAAGTAFHFIFSEQKEKE